MIVIRTQHVTASYMENDAIHLRGNSLLVQQYKLM